jgi:hypothetical protein
MLLVLYAELTLKWQARMVSEKTCWICLSINITATILDRRKLGNRWRLPSEATKGPPIRIGPVAEMRAGET